MRFYRERNFKETPLGKVPEDWEVVRLKEIVRYTKGKKPRVVSEEFNEGRLPYLSTEYLRNGVPKQFVKVQNETTAEEGDIILLWDGSNAGEFFLAKRGVLSSTMVKIYPKRNFYNSLFLFYLLKNHESLLKAQTKGTGIPHVDKNVLDNMLIILPPLPEQQKIAEILSTVDEAIQKTDEIIAKIERLKKGLMQELLTKGIGHKKFKFSKELGCEIPEDWEVVRLEEISLTIKTGPFGSQLKRSKLSKEGIKVYTQENILNNDFSIGEFYISPEKFQDLKNMEVKPGDVLITIRGSTGVSAVFPHDAKKGIIHTNLAIIRVNKEMVCPEYLSLLINSYSLVKLQIINFSLSTTIGALYAKHIKKIKIPLPPLPEQQKIAEILSTVDKKLELERKHKEKLERIKKALMDILLTGKVRVKE